MNQRLRLLLTISLFVVSAMVMAHFQDVKVVSLPTLKQLPVNAISRIFQDSEGYMWYGTADGLCRDDGYSVHVFRNDFNTPNPMKINLIWCITEDKEHHIWFGTQKGAYILNKRNYSIKPVEQKELQSIPVYNIYATSDGFVWMAVGNTLYKFGQDGKLDKKIPIKSSINCMYEDSRKRLYIATSSEGMLVKDAGSDNIKLLDRNINAICMVEDNSHKCMWIGVAEGGFVRYDFRSRRSVGPTVANMPAYKAGVWFYSLQQDNKYGYLWAQSAKDLHVFKTTPDMQLEALSTEGLITPGYKMLDHIFKTRNGNIWVPAFDKNSFYIDFQQETIKTIPVEPMRQLTNYEPAIVTLCKDEGGYYWYYQERCGLFLYNPSTSHVTPYYNSASTRNLPLNIVPYLIKSRQTNSIWAMTLQKSVIQLQRVGDNMQATQVIDLKKLAHKPDNLECIFEDRDGNLWIGTMNGIYIYNVKRQQLRTISDNIGDVSDFTQTSDGNIWCTIRNKGLCRIDAQYRHKLYAYDMDFLNLDATSDGRLWVGTDEGRVIAFDSAHPDKYDDYTEQCGMNGDMVDHIKVDKFNHIWIVTNQRIREFNPRNGAFRIFNTNEENIPLRRFLPRAVYLDQTDGNIYFGGIPGIISFTPSQSLETMARNVKVHISDVKVMGNSVWFMPERSKTENSIEIMPDEQNLVVEFSTLEYNYCDKIRYAYRLHGVDQDWVYLPVGENRAIYNKVPKGKHTFEVKATDENGQWSKHITKFTINRLPAWYETIWAYIIYIMTAVGIVYLILRQYLLIMKEREERQLVENLLKAKQMQIQSEQKEAENRIAKPNASSDKNGQDIANVNNEPINDAAKQVQIDVTQTESSDSKFLKKAIDIVEKNLSNPKLDVVFLASEMGMSRSTFMRKIKAVAGQTPLDFIKSVKLKHAYLMLQDKTATIQYVMEAIGYSDHKTFTQSFKGLFGMTPSEHQRSSKTETDE